jgi:uncharacterized protein
MTVWRKTAMATLLGVLWCLLANGQGKQSRPTDRLAVAAERGDVASVRSLLSAGLDVNSRDAGGWTPLMHASFRGQRAIVKLLLSKGAKVNLADSSGYTALTCTILRTREEGVFHGDLISLLLNHGANVNVRDKDGNTPLLLMLDVDICFGCLPEVPKPKTTLAEAVQMLIRKGADVTVRNKRGRSALQLATTQHKVYAMPSRSEEQVAELSRTLYGPVAEALRKAGAK